ncbi:hypothetical protein [Thiofilum flexile]|uniref:hypothetical protein n=1 Tax=Thiofilum flexile TaxID=125627 RepID=UPI000360A23C|nr:hypothetical protein [Thiofilum flexile]
MCGYNCEKKKLLAESIASGYRERIKNIQIAEHTLGDIIKNKYIAILDSLKNDLQIFLGANVAMFFILFILSLIKPSATSHLFLPGLLLLIATVLSSCVYIFGQNWFYTILYNDYMGFWYLAYIAVIFGFLLDVSLFKARVTTEVINTISNLIGSTFSLAPC